MRGDALARTRFHLRTGITSVVPWLVVFADHATDKTCQKWDDTYGAGNRPESSLIDVKRL